MPPAPVIPASAGIHATRMTEFTLIDRIRRRVHAARPDIVLGIGDDAALLRVPPGQLLVVTMDTLNAGVHFPGGTAPADIGWKALAVNLSDLAAMGATPAWCTLSLSLPDADATWLDGFLDGFLEIAGLHDVALVGGDTTRGPLAIGVTAHGFIEEGRALRRDGARVGDDVWVSGTLGDAAAGLVFRDDAALRARLDRPTPRIALGRALSGLASAAIDVSDGLLADLGHVCAASGVGATVDIAALPASAALRGACAADDEARRCFQATGGDDYELCFAVPPDRAASVLAVSREAAVPVTRVGTIEAGDAVVARDADGRAWHPAATGYVHFSRPAATSPD